MADLTRDHIHLFNTNAQFVSAYSKDNYYEPWISYTIDTSALTYNKTYKEKMQETPLTFVVRENGTFKFSGWTASNTLSYSLDGGETWVALAHNTDTPTVSAGSRIMWKGTPTPRQMSGIGKFSSTGAFDVEGNIMSILYGDNFIGEENLTKKPCAFYDMFKENNIVNANNLILPPTTSERCYSGLFAQCLLLVTVPELPATELASYCYAYMFQGTPITGVPSDFLPGETLNLSSYMCMFQYCSSLTKAPSLPATTLASQCYTSMFSGCTSLTTAPELPATTLINSCYERMFIGCTNLSYIKCLATDISANACTSGWVADVAANGTFVCASGMENTWTSGAAGVPIGWEIETE